MSNNHYNVLGVSKAANIDEIKKAYRELARKWHPDRNRNNVTEANGRFQAINQAYEVLSDTVQRERYDLSFSSTTFNTFPQPPNAHTTPNFNTFGGNPSYNNNQWGPFSPFNVRMAHRRHKEQQQQREQQQREHLQREQQRQRQHREQLQQRQREKLQRLQQQREQQQREEQQREQQKRDEQQREQQQREEQQREQQQLEQQQREKQQREQQQREEQQREQQQHEKQQREQHQREEQQREQHHHHHRPIHTTASSSTTTPPYPPTPPAPRPSHIPAYSSIPTPTPDSSSTQQPHPPPPPPPQQQQQQQPHTIPTPASSSRPRSIKRPLPATLENLYCGTTKRLKVTKKTRNGQKLDKILSINIPPGTKSGAKFVYPNEGDELEDGQNQDIEFTVEEIEHESYGRQDDNLTVTMNLTLVEALTGFSKEFPALDKTMIPLSSNSTIQPGQRVRLNRRGMPNLETGRRGDLVVTYNVVFPTNLTEVQKQIISDTLGGTT